MGDLIPFKRGRGGASKQARREELYRKLNVPMHKRKKRKARSKALPTIKAIMLTGLAATVVGGGLGAWMAFGNGRAEASAETSTSAVSVHFSLCDQGGGRNCVIDGDTFRFNGDKIRVVGIDTPETHPSRCAREEDLGQRATVRFQELLNAGPFELRADADRDTDKYGRYLRSVYRGGSPVGDALINEGLARPYNGGARASWCD